MQFRCDIIQLFITAVLNLVKRKQDNGHSNLFDISLIKCNSSESDISEKKDETSNFLNNMSDVSRVQLSCGYNHTVHVCPRGQVISWGAAGEARLGHGRLTGSSATPSLVHLFRSVPVGVLSVSCGKQHSLSLTTAGVFSWGCNKFGQLGLGQCWSGH